MDEGGGGSPNGEGVASGATRKKKRGGRHPESLNNLWFRGERVHWLLATLSLGESYPAGPEGTQ